MKGNCQFPFCVGWQLGIGDEQMNLPFSIVHFPFSIFGD